MTPTIIVWKTSWTFYDKNKNINQSEGKHNFVDIDESVSSLF